MSFKRTRSRVVPETRLLFELPASAMWFRARPWSDIAPYYDELARAPLTPGTASSWLLTWSRLEELIDEASHLAFIAYTRDTADPALEGEYLRFATVITPTLTERRAALAQRLISAGINTPATATTVRRLTADASIFRAASGGDLAELETLGARYQKLIGGTTVDWDGELLVLPQLQKLLESPDRVVRERAFRAESAACLAMREELSSLFDRMLGLRARVAHEAGYRSFRDYVWVARHRFDYTPADCERFREAVKQTVVPALAQVYAHRRQRLGVESLRPWDLRVDAGGALPLAPFTDSNDLIAKTRHVFRRLDSRFGSWFDAIVGQGLLDLDARRNKAPGAYCAGLSDRRVPFLFLNAVGTASDVRTMLHESGHGFHEMAIREHPLFWQRQVGTEAAELASMSMELLASKHLSTPGGFYSQPDAARAQIELLEDILVKLAYVASVDAFQDWIYTSPNAVDPSARDQAWLEVRRTFEPEVDWEGLRAERTTRWYRQLHIFKYPLYYIEYGIAQLGALQIWAQSLHDPDTAVARYKRALSIGATLPLPEIYRAAGARLVFDAKGLSELVDCVVREIATLRISSERTASSAARQARGA